MTPEERAEKIIALTAGRDRFNERSGVKKEIAAEIQAAVEEAIMTEQLRQEESEIEKIKRAVEEENRLGQIAVDLARRQAYEDAAKIANRWADTECHCGDFIEKAIRARAKEVCK